MSKKILIVDDHPFFREGLKTIISRDDTFVVIGEAGNAREALLLAQKLKPDITLIDISLPDTSGIELIKEILRLVPKTTIIVVSMHSKIYYIKESIQAGARGYVIKDSATDILLQALEAVSRGQYFLDSSLSEELAGQLLHSFGQDKDIIDSKYSALTSRQQEIIRFLAQGLTAKQISGRLNLSPKTIENHRHNILHKLHLHNTVELIQYAARIGLIEMDFLKQ